MDSMVALRAHTKGGPDVLVYESAPRPTPGDDEVLVGKLVKDLAGAVKKAAA